MVIKQEVERLRDEYNNRFKNREREPYATAYRGLTLAIRSNFSGSFFEYYTSPEEEMPEEIEQAYSKLKRLLELRVVK